MLKKEKIKAITTKRKKQKEKLIYLVKEKRVIKITLEIKQI